MKKKRLFIHSLVIFLITIFTGCFSSADIVKPQTPMSEQCILIDPPNGYYGNILIEGAHGKIIFPAGNHHLELYDEFEVVLGTERISETREYITYAEYKVKVRENWSCDYEFKHGMSYNIQKGNSHITYDNYNKRLIVDRGYGEKIIVTANTLKSNNTYRSSYSYSHKPGEDITINESGKGKPMTVYVGTVATPQLGVGLYEYGPSTPNLSLGGRFGLQIIRNWLDVSLIAEAGGNAGFYPPGLGFSAGYNYGGMLDFIIPKSLPRFGIGIGGGMAGGVLLGQDKESSTNDYRKYPYNFPYAGIDLIFRSGYGNSSTVAIGTRYYFNDTDKWYNKFSIYFKTH